MKSLIGLVIVTVVARVSDCYAGELDQQMHQAIGACLDQEGVTLEELQAFRDGKYDNGGAGDNLKCYTKCVMVKFGGMDENESLNEAVIFDKFGPVLGQENLKEIWEQCKDKTGEGKCQTAYEIFSCLKSFKDVFGFSKE